MIHTCSDFSFSCSNAWDLKNLNAPLLIYEGLLLNSLLEAERFMELSHLVVVIHESYDASTTGRKK
jgi:hypothetical protein